MKLTKDNSTVIGFRLSNDDLAAVDEIARREDRKRSYVLRRCVLDGINVTPTQDNSAITLEQLRDRVAQFTNPIVEIDGERFTLILDGGERT